MYGPIWLEVGIVTLLLVIVVYYIIIWFYSSMVEQPAYNGKILGQYQVELLGRSIMYTTKIVDIIN